MKNRQWLLVIGVLIGMIGGWLWGTGQPANTTHIVSSVSSSAQGLKMDMRKLWEDRIIWTRAYFVSTTYNLDGRQAALDRLLQNQVDIGNAIKPYYGSDNGEKLTDLLKEHISFIGQMVQASLEQNQAAFNQADAQWQDNGNTIADFLAAINPSWSQADMRAMIKKHSDLLRQEARDILAKKPQAAVSDYDKLHNQTLEMADRLSDGITNQYPDKF